MKVGVVDYEAGNLRSVETVLKHLGADYIISNNPDVLFKSDKLIFPGVGEASSAMSILRRDSLDDFLKSYAASGKLILGICLGCQIILDKSEEGSTGCLSLIPGNVVSFKKETGLKIPQIGWNSVTSEKDHFLFKGIPQDSSFYFVHSYYTEVEDVYSIGKTDYGTVFSSALAKENISAVQFHPEKSGRHGIKLIDNFLKEEG
jgi:glutamine amidotransferase